jgi:hypothetical protein
VYQRAAASRFACELASAKDLNGSSMIPNWNPVPVIAPSRPTNRTPPPVRRTSWNSSRSESFAAGRGSPDSLKCEELARAPPSRA